MQKAKTPTRAKLATVKRAQSGKASNPEEAAKSGSQTVVWSCLRKFCGAWGGRPGPHSHYRNKGRGVLLKGC